MKMPVWLVCFVLENRKKIVRVIWFRYILIRIFRANSKIFKLFSSDDDARNRLTVNADPFRESVFITDDIPLFLPFTEDLVFSARV